jgi:uncharacterized protein YbjQ (UPF0145 family)
MLTVTTDTLPGYEILSLLGFVDGCAVWLTKTASPSGDGMLYGKRLRIDPAAAADNHANAAPNCVNDAIDDMIDRAREMGADAVIGIRVSPVRGSELHMTTAEGKLRSLAGRISEAVNVMYVYGTAVRVRKIARVVAAAKP